MTYKFNTKQEANSRKVTRILSMEQVETLRVEIPTSLLLHMHSRTHFNKQQEEFC
jgi:hypothetical protein